MTGVIEVHLTVSRYTDCVIRCRGPSLFGAIIDIDNLRRDRLIHLSDARARARVTRLRNLRR